MKHLLTIVFLLATAIGYGQMLTPTVLATGGNYSEGGGYSLSSTTGEIMVTTLQSGSHYLTQGFQQPLVFIEDTTAVEPSLTFDGVKIYPNPVSDQLTIEVPTEEGVDIQLQLLDLLGKSVTVQTVRESAGAVEYIKLNLSDLAPGIYFVYLQSTKGNLRSTFKIQKID